MQAHYAARAREERGGFTAPFPYCDLARPMFEELLAVAPADGEAGPTCGPEDACATTAGAGQAAARKTDYALFDCI
jgi:hypothetical protein